MTASRSSRCENGSPPPRAGRRLPVTTAVVGHHGQLRCQQPGHLHPSPPVRDALMQQQHRRAPPGHRSPARVVPPRLTSNRSAIAPSSGATRPAANQFSGPSSPASRRRPARPVRLNVTHELVSGAREPPLCSARGLYGMIADTTQKAVSVQVAARCRRRRSARTRWGVPGVWRPSAGFEAFVEELARASWPAMPGNDGSASPSSTGSATRLTWCLPLRRSAA